MNFRAIPAVLLFSLVIPIVMKYRILPIEGTPYWLFGIVFFALIAKVWIDMFPKIFEKWNGFISVGLLIVVLSIVIGGTTWTAIVDRHKIAPVWGTHDIILQLEAAMRYLIQGKNPYQETYFGTPVEMFHYDEMGNKAVNPALYHFVMPPWYLIAPFPIYIVANRTIGYFDGRMMSLLSLVLILLCIWFMLKNRILKETAVTLLALSPATFDYFLEGRSDVFALAWLIASLFFLQKKRIVFSSVCMGLALMSKQTIWFAFPVWLTLFVSHNVVRNVVFALKNRNKHFSYTDIKPLIQAGVISAVVALFLMMPFILWNAKSFIDSVILYLSAGGKTGYPVSGYGFSMLLYSAGIIKELRDYFPFTLLQLGVGIPVLLPLLYYLSKKNTFSRFFMVYGTFLFIIWYFSRYFNNSHIAFLSTIFCLAALFYYDEQYSEEVIKRK